jgi:dTDP-glucose 4,6-dehydratase
LEACRRRWLGGSGGDPGARYRFHHISTDEVYGSLAADDPPFSESTAYAPNSPYSASKAGSDHLVRAYHHTYALPVTTSNCSNNYGPRQHPEKFIPTVIRSCLEGVPIPVYGSGDNVRDWLHVWDHCRGIERVLADGRLGRTYNFGGDNEYANIDIAKRICALMDRLRPRSEPHRELIRFVADRPGHDWRYAIDATRAQTELQWRPEQDFNSALEATCHWYLARPPSRPVSPETGGPHLERP